MPEAPPRRNPQRWFVFLLLLGIFLTVRGYRCLDGDQAYRLPMFLRGEDPSLFADDPFVRSFDDFNPHRGSYLVIGLLARPLGLPIGLGVLFVATFVATGFGIDRLTRTVWPEAAESVGLVAFGLFLATVAGNIGTNHLFEPILLDRMMASALAWLAIGALIESPTQGLKSAPSMLMLATVVHPTLGLQITLLIGGMWVAWAVLPVGASLGFRKTAVGLLAFGAALVPGLWLNMAHSGGMLDGLPVDVFRRISLELQGPQHMLPHLWRRPQWLAWFGFPVLAGVSLLGSQWRENPSARRLLTGLALNLIGLAVAWVGVEGFGHLRLTLFQPFRLATVCRGLCLVVLAGHWLRLWNTGSAFARTRAALLLVALAGDWSMVVVTLFETTMTLADVTADRRQLSLACKVLGWLFFGAGVVYLSRHDTESGHVPLMTVAIGGFSGFVWLGRWTPAWTTGRKARLTALVWAVPLAALAVQVLPAGAVPIREGWREGLSRRCRFGEVPIDDLERLALWCRDHTAADSRFIGPPGPKTFRLWSRRPLMFNRAGSPYNAKGLADWAERFRDHVGYTGPVDAFVSAYQRDRHALEKGYERLDAAGLAELAWRQGADHVVARFTERTDGSLELLHREGSWGVYRVSPGGAEIAKGPGETRALR